MSTAEMYEGQKMRLAKSMIKLVEESQDLELAKITLRSYFRGYFGEAFEPESWVES